MVIGMAERTTPNTGQMRQTTVFISYIYSQLGRRGHCMLHGPHGNCTPKQNAPPGAVGSRFCSVKRVGYHLVPTGECDWLI